VEHSVTISCRACGAATSESARLKCDAPGEYRGNVVNFLLCEICGFAFAPENTYPFDDATAFQGSSAAIEANGRVGTSERPGREYFMGGMAAEILQLAGLPISSVLVYGAGLSRDHVWLSKGWPGVKVCIADIKNFQRVDNFVRLDDTSRFDIVLACEVVEHFIQIDSDFSALLSKVAEDGILVLSTNIRDKSPLSSLAYPFVRGHTAYYSSQALRAIVGRFDPRLKIDLRTPRAALGQLGPRKRYVLIYRDEAIIRGIADYFALHPWAPSEGVVRASFLSRLFRSIIRSLGRFRLKLPTIFNGSR
jgi:SAM-dependent methyltransferase